MIGSSGFMKTLTLKLDQRQDPPTIVKHKGTVTVGSHGLDNYDSRDPGVCWVLGLAWGRSCELKRCHSHPDVNKTSMAS